MKLPKVELNTTNLLNIGGGIVVIYLVVTLAQTIKKNYDLGQQISTLKGQISLLQAQETAANYQLQYAQTNSAMDKAAREDLNLQLPGEHVIIIPNDSPSPSPTPEVKVTSPTQNQSDIQQWISFLMGRT